MNSIEEKIIRIGVYPTSANPPTWGHADLVFRASALFDRVYWCAAVNTGKHYQFSTEDRLKMMQIYVDEAQLKNVIVDSFTGSTVRYAESKQATVILKGIRNTLDYQGELEQSVGNRGINPHVETICLLAQPKLSTVSSSLVRELAFLGESIDDYVHPKVAHTIHTLMKKP